MKILKKDLKRKKVMNFILFVFMIMASVLIASSTNLLYSTVTAIDDFKEISKAGDLITVVTAGEDSMKKIEEWSKNSAMMKSTSVDDMMIVDQKEVTSSEGLEVTGTTLTLATMPKENNLVFNQEGNTFEIGNSEAAVPVSIKKKLKLKLGDDIKIKINGYEKTFQVTCFFKDVVMGSEMMGIKRILLTKEDYQSFSKKATDKNHIKFCSFMKQMGYKNSDLEKGFNQLSLPTFSVMTSDVINVTYMLDMIIAGVMIIVSIFLILISFLILRFTIVFTVQEDFKQIGVMKAIGLKNRGIRSIYMIKYLTLSLTSGAVGLALSYPVSKLLKKNIAEYILLRDSIVNLLCAILSVLFVVVVTILFCNISTGKIKKLSAIDAIRQGTKGERFKNTKKLNLHRRKWLSTPLFLAISDITSNFKKFIILMITFALGTAIIIIPSNVISTLSSDEIVSTFGYLKSDFYVNEMILGDKEQAITKMKGIEKDFKEKGIEVNLRAELQTMVKIYAENENENKSLLSFQGVGADTGEYQYLKGTPPKIENEIAITEKLAQYFDVSIGDRVTCEVQDDSREVIITAMFQTMNNLGYGIRFAEDYQMVEDPSSSIVISGMLQGNKKVKLEQIEKLKDDFPNLDIKSCREFLNEFLGDTTKQIDALKNLILLIVLGINFLITTLLLRMLISKEVPEIAILKSLGYDSFTIKSWQVYRIGIVLLISIILGTILANTTGNSLNKGIFRTMGATKMQLQVEPLQVYLIYPLLLFTVVMIAVFCSLGQIKKTHVWEINNQE